MRSARHRGPWILLIFIFLMSGSIAQARKLHIKTGLFDFAAKLDSEDGKISNIGVYQITFYQDVLPQVNIFGGYTLLMSNGIGGDLGFGLEVGTVYYFLTDSTGKSYNESEVTISYNDLWRPYAGIGFLERRFQSIDSNFAGFLMMVGTERQLENHNLSLMGELKVSQLLGANNSEATEILILFGVSFAF